VGELFRVRDDAPNGGDQRVKLDRFGFELVAARGSDFLALARYRKRRRRLPTSTGQPIDLAALLGNLEMPEIGSPNSNTNRDGTYGLVKKFSNAGFREVFDGRQTSRRSSLNV
jgi:hypothetical protein